MRALTDIFWAADELAWAQECLAAGDTLEDIAEMAGRSLADVQRNVTVGMKLTDRQRLAARLYAAGATVRDIGRAIKPDTPRPDSLGASYIKTIRAKGYALAARRVGRSPDQEARRHG